MKNPLNKRLPRDLKSEFGKHLVIFILMTATIGFVSGFLVADGSMIIAYNESFEKYNIEDGHFISTNKVHKAQINEIEKNHVTLYENFFVEEKMSNDSTIRIFANREEVNKVCLMEGSMPKSDDELAIDRMYADNNGLSVGDTIQSSSKTWKICGLVALSDYSCLFSDNNDSMFDAVKFGVGIVTNSTFTDLKEDQLHYEYVWKYDVFPESEKEEKEVSDDLMKVVNDETQLEEFVPRYTNQAINFTGEDMGGDRMMMIVLLYLIIVIMAFVFGVTVNNTITKEANVIGTLRAMGYHRKELLVHYLTMPLLVTLTGAVIGNLLGYTVMKEVCAGMYYGSYSLPTYVTIWSMEAFFLTTVIPLILMTLINTFILWNKLSLSPLKFLRRDLKRRVQKHVFPLSKRIGFFTRFRLRIIMQNIGSYVILGIGILFANLLLMFGLIFPSILNHYQENIVDNMLCNYQCIFTVPADALDEDHKLTSMISMMKFQKAIDTDEESAEKFSAYSLSTLEGDYPAEEVLLYGVEKDSQYVKEEFEENDVYISRAYADKFDVGVGDIITLEEEYEETQYQFEVTGIYDYEGGICVFMTRDQLNKTFDLDKDYYSGYFADKPIEDIEEKYIGNVIDLESLTKISRQLTVSMGGMMNLVNGFAILIFVVIVYLLSKMIIEKNAQSISMTKILGYSNMEIGRLYIMATTIAVVLFILISLPVVGEIMYLLFKFIMIQSISGWIPFYMDPIIYIKIFLIGILTYGVVACFEYRRIGKIPMDTALKNVE